MKEKGLTIEDIKLGSSSSRNPNLVNIFHRLNFVEAYSCCITKTKPKKRICINYRLFKTNFMMLKIIYL